MASRRRAATGRWLAGAMVAAGLTLLAGCRTWNPDPIDLADPAWRIRQGQAVWHPAGSGVELAGELLVAGTADDRAYLQFSKPPIVLAEVRLDPGRWAASFPAKRRAYHAPGEPPGRLGWAQLLRITQGRTPAGGWEFSGSLDTRWRLAHERSGEWIEGTGLP